MKEIKCKSSGLACVAIRVAQVRQVKFFYYTFTDPEGGGSEGQNFPFFVGKCQNRVKFTHFSPIENKK
jgi:hypothetical protein